MEILKKIKPAEAVKTGEANGHYDKGDIMIRAQENEFKLNYEIDCIYITNKLALGDWRKVYRYLSLPAGKRLLRGKASKNLSEEVEAKEYKYLYFLDWKTGRFICDNKKDRFEACSGNKYMDFFCFDTLYTINDQSSAICVLGDSKFENNDPKIFGLLPAQFFAPENRVALENLAKKNIEYSGVELEESDEKLKGRYIELKRIYKEKCAEYDAIPETRMQEAESKKLNEITAAAEKRTKEESETKKREKVQAAISKWDDEIQVK